MKKLVIMKFWILAGFMLLSGLTYAQFNFGGQMIQRAEFRNGFGTLINDTVQPAVFVGQRLRLQGTYAFDNVELYASIQDIRTWGNTSQVKASDAFMSIHEAYAQVSIDSFWAVKLGRQELNYDNARFLGNLDWALQARAHDFALVKYEKKDFKLHFGGGFNQASPVLSDNLYLVTQQYKTAQMLRMETKNKDFTLSFLFWNDGRQFQTFDTTGMQTDRGVRFAQTIGLPTIKYKMKGLTVSGFAYYQLGEDVAGNTLGAYDVNAQITKDFKIKKNPNASVTLTLGIEMLSGTNMNNTDATNNSFNPLYGTNHGHNGYMDYFFVDGRGVNSVGLNDAYLKMKYAFSKSQFISVQLHNFSANADVVKTGIVQDAAIGNELDISYGHVFNKSLSLQAGYSQFFGTETMEYLRNQANPDNMQNWAYCMLIIRPNSTKKFTGIIH